MATVIAFSMECDIMHQMQGFLFISFIAILFVASLVAVTQIVVSKLTENPTPSFNRSFLIAAASAVISFVLLGLIGGLLSKFTTMYLFLILWCVPNTILNKMFLKFDNQTVSWFFAIGSSLTSALVLILLAAMTIGSLW